MTPGRERLCGIGQLICNLPLGFYGRYFEHRDVRNVSKWLYIQQKSHASRPLCFREVSLCYPRGPTNWPGHQKSSCDTSTSSLPAYNTIEISSKSNQKPRRLDWCQKHDKAALLSHHFLRDHDARFPASQSSDHGKSDNDASHAAVLRRQCIYRQIRVFLQCVTPINNPD